MYPASRTALLSPLTLLSAHRVTMMEQPSQNKTLRSSIPQRLFQVHSEMFWPFTMLSFPLWMKCKNGQGTEGSFSISMTKKALFFFWLVWEYASLYSRGKKLNMYLHIESSVLIFKLFLSKGISIILIKSKILICLQSSMFFFYHMLTVNYKVGSAKIWHCFSMCIESVGRKAHHPPTLP